MRIELLGGLQVRMPTRTVEALPSRRVAALLGYLALHPGWQSREEVAEAVWTDQEEGRATASLRNALSVLRRALEPDGAIDGSPIEANRLHVRLLRDQCDCDVWSFRASTETGDFLTAVQLYQGPLLPGLNDVWIEPLRDELQTAFALAASVESRKALEVGLPHRALELARRWKEADPFEPESTRLIALAEAECGLVHAALNTLQRYVSWYEQELGEPPPMDTMTIEKEIHARAKRPKPGKLTVLSFAEEGRNPTLPIYLTRYFGRTAELAYISSWSGGPSILLNIVGMGGMGKTRLAVEAATHFSTEWKTVFVPLVGVQSKESAIYALCNAFGMRDNGQSDPLHSLWTYLSQITGPVMIVLDNLEQILSPISELLTELIRWNLGVKFLCTSREVLGLEGEATLALSPFQIHDEEELSDDWAQNSAVEMFFDRAKNARFDFDLNGQNFRQVLALCRELDAVPLAIEIMAAWAGTWSISKMRENVQNRQLPARAKTPDARHRTLEECIDWSFQLLDEPSRRDLCTLSLFKGGWTAEAAEAVLDVSDIDSVLAKLVDRSLISSVELEARRRFSMLEMVRGYCHSRLDQPTAQEASPKLVAYFQRLATVLANPCAGAQEVENHRALDREQDNVEAAVELCEAGLASVDEGFGLLGAMGLHWSYRGQNKVGLSLIHRLLALPKEPVGVGRLMGLQTLSILSQSENDSDLAQFCLQEMEELSGRLSDPEVRFRVINQIGNFHNRFGRFEEAGRWHGDALDLANVLNISRFQAASHSNLAESLFGRGLKKDAIEQWEIAVRLDARNGNAAGEAMLFLGFAHCENDRFAIGAGELEKYLRNANHLGYAQGIARVVYFASFLATRLGKPELSRVLHSSARDYIRKEGILFDILESKCAAIVEAALSGLPPVPANFHAPLDIREAVEITQNFLRQAAELAPDSEPRLSSETRNSH
jgi:predicted ATPase